MLLFFSVSTFQFLNMKKPRHSCNKCNKSYKRFASLKRHLIYECEKEPQFKCLTENCNYKGKRKESVRRHIISKHPDLANQLKEQTNR